MGEIIADNAGENDYEIPVKSVRIEERDPAVAAPIRSAGIESLTSLFKISRDKLWVRNDNLINFVSCDGVLITPVGRELINKLLIKLSDTKEESAELGMVISIRENKRFIFNLSIKENYDSKTFAKNIESAVITLREAMEGMKVKTLSLSREGNGFDKMPWTIIENIFRTHFGKGGYEITVCTGEVEIPDENNRIVIFKSAMTQQ